MKIAYLAPEIPALSATFVYNEIEALQNLGVEIEAFSVHIPKAPATDINPAVFSRGVNYLYREPKATVLASHLKCILTSPINYFATLVMMLVDVVRLGVVNRTAVGQVMRFFYGCYFSRLLKQKKCAHIHVHFAHVPTDIAMYAAKMAGIGYSVTSHANDIFERGWLLKEKVSRSVFFATISEFNIAHLKSKNVDTRKLQLVRCGVDDAKLQAAIVPSSAAESRFKFGAIGRLVEKKGFDVLLKAAKRLKDRGLPIEVHIAGSGPEEQALKTLAQTLGLTNCLVMPGALPHSAVASFTQQLDVFCLPCKTDANGDMDGIPVVTMEAMLLGVPVVTSRLSGIPELVIHEKTGLLAEENDDEAIANLLERLYTSEDFRNTLTAQATAHVKREFTQIVNAKKLKHLIEQSLT